MIRPLLLSLLAAGPAAAQTCGGPFGGFLEGVRAEALAAGRDPAAVDAFLAGARRDPDVLAADRRQGIFTLPFTEFARRVISRNRIENGRRNARDYAATFDAIERELGVPRGVLLAFWALETDYGAVQGDYDTRDALLTLAHDCRRPDLFRPQVLAAIRLTEAGAFAPGEVQGAWAGEIGMVQMLPLDILENGRDGDGDGRVDLRGSPRDALVSGATLLRDLGWRPNEPWLQEVTVPAGFDWSLSGLDGRRPAADWAAMGVAPRQGTLADLPAALIAPEGREGPKFLAYPNFEVLFEWNQSFVYVTTAAYMATRLEGAPVFDAGTPAEGLDQDAMRELQTRLRARGHDVGGVDGILGARTRDAVRAEQARLGIPPDGWPTPALLRAL